MLIIRDLQFLTHFWKNFIRKCYGLLYILNNDIRKIPLYFTKNDIFPFQAASGQYFFEILHSNNVFKINKHLEIQIKVQKVFFENFGSINYTGKHWRFMTKKNAFESLTFSHFFTKIGQIFSLYHDWISWWTTSRP